MSSLLPLSLLASHLVGSCDSNSTRRVGPAPSMLAACRSVGPVRSDSSPSAVATASRALHASFSRSEKLTSPNAEIEYCSGLVVATRITRNYFGSYSDSLGFHSLSGLCLGQESPASMHEEFIRITMNSKELQRIHRNCPEFL